MGTDLDGLDRYGGLDRAVGNYLPSFTSKRTGKIKSMDFSYNAQTFFFNAVELTYRLVS